MKSRSTFSSSRAPASSFRACFGTCTARRASFASTHARAFRAPFGERVARRADERVAAGVDDGEVPLPGPGDVNLVAVQGGDPGMHGDTAQDAVQARSIGVTMAAGASSDAQLLDDPERFFAFEPSDHATKSAR